MEGRTVNQEIQGPCLPNQQRDHQRRIQEMMKRQDSWTGFRERAFRVASTVVLPRNRRPSTTLPRGAGELKARSLSVKSLPQIRHEGTEISPSRVKYMRSISEQNRPTTSPAPMTRRADRIKAAPRTSCIHEGDDEEQLSDGETNLEKLSDETWTNREATMSREPSQDSPRSFQAPGGPLYPQTRAPRMDRPRDLKLTLELPPPPPHPHRSPGSPDEPHFVLPRMHRFSGQFVGVCFPSQFSGSRLPEIPSRPMDLRFGPRPPIGRFTVSPVSTPGEPVRPSIPPDLVITASTSDFEAARAQKSTFRSARALNELYPQPSLQVEDEPLLGPLDSQAATTPEILSRDFPPRIKKKLLENSDEDAVTPQVSFDDEGEIILEKNEENFEKGQEESLTYGGLYDCMPPPIFMLIITIIEIGVFIYHTRKFMNDPNYGYIRKYSPAPLDSSLIYNPTRRYEIWRYLTYALVHSGYMHIINNVVVQLVLGILLEVVHKWPRVLAIYFAGILAGSLATSISEPFNYLAGASAGVYALITAHVSTVILNWSEMEYPWVRLLFFVAFIAHDAGTAIYFAYILGEKTNIGYAAHLGGAVAGLLVGIHVLRNLQWKEWEVVLWYTSLAICVLLLLFAIAWNIIRTDLYP